MQHGEYVVEQVLDAQAEGFQVAQGGARQVGMALRAGVVTSDAARSGCRRPRFGVSRTVAIASDTACGAIGQRWSEAAGSAVVIISDAARGGCRRPRFGVSRSRAAGIASDTARGAIGQQWSEAAGSAIAVTSDMAGGMGGWSHSGVSRAVAIASGTMRGVIGRPRSGVSRVVVADVVVAEPSGKHDGGTLDQMQRCKVFCEASLRLRRISSKMLSGGEPHIPLEHMWSVIRYRATKQTMFRLPIEPAIVERPIGVTDEPAFIRSAASE